jgi:hypothetical protein
LIIDLYKLDVGELFEVERERACDVVERAVGLAVPREINMGNAIGIFELAIACKAVEDEGKALVAFNIAGSFEKFVQDPADQVLCGRDKARHRDFVR